jgi:hypothetical protein
LIVFTLVTIVFLSFLKFLKRWNNDRKDKNSRIELNPIDNNDLAKPQKIDHKDLSALEFFKHLFTGKIAISGSCFKLCLCTGSVKKEAKDSESKGSVKKEAKDSESKGLKA